MAGQSINDLLNANIELVRKGALPDAYRMAPDLAVQRVTGKSESHRITKTTNGLDFRAPIEFSPPGVFGAFNSDGGALGLGSGISIAQFTQTYFATKLAFQLSWASRMGTATGDQSVINIFRRTMELGLPNAAQYDDASWHNLGGSDGQWGVVTAYTNISGTAGQAGSTGTYTFDSDVGVRMAIPGQRFEIINGATYTTGATGVSPDSLPYIIPGTINYKARTCQISVPTTLTQAPANGDVLYFQGATPSGTPTWLQGRSYVNNTSTSGTYLGLSRTTYPYINCNSDTTGGTLTPDQILSMRNLIANVSGMRNDKLNIIGLASTHQLAVMNKTVQNMQVFYRSQVTEKQIDPLPQATVEGGIVYGGLTFFEDFRQSVSRIDFCNPQDWGRVYLSDKPGMDFYKDLEGRMFFPLVSSSNGGPSAADLFYLVSTHNFYNLRPWAQGVMTGLSGPGGNYSY